MTATLRDWWVMTLPADGYTAPEQAWQVVVGIVNGHPTRADGKQMRTSGIVKVEGREITTASGSVYRLEGEPKTEYLEWMKANGYRYDAENPIGIGRDSRKQAEAAP